MNVAEAMERMDGEDHLGHVEPRLLLVQALVALEDVEEIATRAELHG